MAQNEVFQCVISYQLSTEKRNLLSLNIFGSLTYKFEKKFYGRLDNQILGSLKTRVFFGTDG